MEQQSTKEKHARLRNIAEGMLPDTLLMLAFLEHQVDLAAQVQLDVIDELEKEGFLDTYPEDKKSRLTALKNLMSHSSIDFNNINHALQSYKLPQTTDHKKDMRNVQNQYLRAQIKEGILGKV